MRATVTFLIVSLGILVVTGTLAAGTAVDHDIPRSSVAALALLGTLGLTRRDRRIRQNQAI